MTGSLGDKLSRDEIQEVDPCVNSYGYKSIPIYS